MRLHFRIECLCAQPTAVEGDSFDGLPALFGGVQSVNATHNPGFAGANHAFIWYCSSDCHMGAGCGHRAHQHRVHATDDLGATSQRWTHHSVRHVGLSRSALRAAA